MAKKLTKQPDRIKTLEELEQETEFYRRKNLANETIYNSSPSSFECVIKANGVELGSRTEVFRRKKLIQVLYVLPSLKRYEELMKLPVAKSVAK